MVILLYILLIAYIAAINFYAFLLVKTLKRQETEDAARRQAEPPSSYPQNQPPEQKYIGKLCITGALGGAIAVYACMFLMKFRRDDLFLMVVMPLLGVVNVYVWILLFRSGLGFYIAR